MAALASINKVLALLTFAPASSTARVLVALVAEVVVAEAGVAGAPALLMRPGLSLAVGAAQCARDTTMNDDKSQFAFTFSVSR